MARIMKSTAERYNELAAMDTEQQSDAEIEEQVELYYALKQQRYDELAAMDTDSQTDAEIEEQVTLYYELY
jgi:hypothetical protein